MSNQQWPPGRQPGRDPRVPFGSPAPNAIQQPTSIEQYQEPQKNTRRNVVLGAIAVAVVGGVLVGLQYLSSQPDASPSSASGGPTVAASSLGASDRQIPFEGNGTGTFEVVSCTWDDKGVEVTIRITLDEGEASFQTNVFNKQTMQSSEPTDAAPIRVKSGAPQEAIVRFEVPRTAYTIVLTSGNGRDALTALPLPE
ncbi:MAG: hypothetical protein Q4D79_09855 [Propionibacteriaceae bacterium]|nr:hypothetical protein [Propionibacteriaceae bacterium]